MSLAFRSAVAGSVALAGIALGDAMTHGLTGKYSVFSDDYGPTEIWLVGNLVHGLTYAALLWVLVSEGHRVDAGSRIRRFIRLVLVGSFAALALYFLIATPYLYATPANLDRMPALLGVVLLAFPLMFVFALALGIAMRHLPDLRPASRILIAIIPVMGFTILLSFTAADFAHPGYLETVVNFGVAFIGFHATTPARQAPTEAVTVRDNGVH